MTKFKRLFKKIIDFIDLLKHRRRRIEKVVIQLIIYALLITISYVFLFPLFVHFH